MNLAEIAADAERQAKREPCFCADCLFIKKVIPALIAEVERLRAENEAYGHRVGCLRHSADKEREHLTEKLEENAERKSTENWLAAELEAAIAQLAAIREKAAPIISKLKNAPLQTKPEIPQPEYQTPCSGGMESHSWMFAPFDYSLYPKIEAKRETIGAVVNYDDIRALADALKEAE